MSYEIEGKLIKKFDTEQKTDTFKAREFVIETKDDKYPQKIKFQLTQDRCELIDGFEENQMIKVHFDLRGREWNEKYFTNLNAWRVEGDQLEQDLNQVGEDFDDPSFDDGPKYEDFEDTPF
nr:DUF3127 domain-containing protein [Saprospiraceae bacterium]